MKKHLAFVFLLPILLLNLISCIKTGPQGPQGAAGMNGSNGANGNANVFTEYSYSPGFVLDKFHRRSPSIWATLRTPLRSAVVHS